MLTSPVQNSRAEMSGADAARNLIAVQAGFAAKGVALCEAALCGARHFTEWAHYPAHDCTDAGTGFEFYYHAHGRDEMHSLEHGHFHVFHRDSHRPQGFFHLIGISLDFRGLPIRLFTTNQWVTGETMAAAATVSAAAHRFSIRSHGRLAPIARWITAMVRLYASEIAALARERDEKLERLETSRRTRPSLLEDRRIRLLSHRRVNLLHKLSEHCPN